VTRRLSLGRWFMAVSFCRHGTTRRLFFASRCLLIDEASQTPQCVHSNPWPIVERHSLAASRIQHPVRQDDSEIFFQLNDDRQFLSRSQPANDLYLPVKKRVEPINDPSWTKLMSSVLIP